MKMYEVPYNFDRDFFEKISADLDPLRFVECFYIPAWHEDCQCTRQDVTFRDTYPKSYEEYTIRFNMLKALGRPVYVLMQRGATKDLVKKYYGLGARGFIFNDDTLATWMSIEYPDVVRTLSVTRALTAEQIKTEDLSMYDRIVLFYWFNRHLDALKELPKKYNYVLMCNNDCYYDCKWHDAHWFAQGEDMHDYAEKIKGVCEQCRKMARNELKNSAIIEPENLVYFDDYVAGYKLVDRLWPTDRILEALRYYAHRNIGAEPRQEEYFSV